MYIMNIQGPARIVLHEPPQLPGYLLFPYGNQFPYGNTVRVDNKGLHCSNGGHRICWGCMADSLDWEEITKGGGASHF